MDAFGAGGAGIHAVIEIPAVGEPVDFRRPDIRAAGRIDNRIGGRDQSAQRRSAAQANIAAVALHQIVVASLEFGLGVLSLHHWVGDASGTSQAGERQPAQRDREQRTKRHHYNFTLPQHRPFRLNAPAERNRSRAVEG